MNQDAIREPSFAGAWTLDFGLQSRDKQLRVVNEPPSLPYAVTAVPRDGLPALLGTTVLSSGFTANRVVFSQES